MKKILLYFLLIILPSSLAHAEAGDAEIGIVFMAADIFPNGAIDGGEFDIFNLTSFEFMDADASASLDREECASDCFPTNVKVNGAPGVIRYPFRALDADKSETITVTEYLSHSRRQFKLYDDDKSGSLSRGEFYAFYQGLKDRTYIANEKKE